MAFYPTIYFGLGKTGELILWHLKQMFKTYCPQALEKDVSFFWLGLSGCDEEHFDSKTCVKLSDSEKILLEHINDKSRQGAQESFWHYLNTQSRPELTHFLSESQIKLVHEPLNKYRVMIFCAMDEPESGILNDLAIYLRLHVNRMRLLTPWIFLSGIGVQTNNSKRANPWIYAMVRELSLMMRPVIKVWGKKRKEFKNEVEQGALFDNIYFFTDGTESEAVAQTAFSLIGRDVSRNKINPTVISGTGDLKVATISSFGIGLPINWISEHAKAFLLFNGLFSESKPEIPDGYLSQKKEIESSIIQKNVEDYFNQASPPLNSIPSLGKRPKFSWDGEVNRTSINNELDAFINYRFNSIYNNPEASNPLGWLKEFFNRLLIYISDKSIFVTHAPMKAPQKKLLKEALSILASLSELYLFEINKVICNAKKIKQSLSNLLEQSQCDISHPNWRIDLFKINNQLISERVVQNFYTAEENKAYQFCLKVNQGEINLVANQKLINLQDSSQNILEKLLDIPIDSLKKQIDSLNIDNIITKELKSTEDKQTLVKKIKVPSFLRFNGGKSINRDYFVQCIQTSSVALGKYFLDTNFSLYFKNQYSSDFKNLIFLYEQIQGIKINGIQEIINSRDRYLNSNLKGTHILPELKTAFDYESKIEELRRYWKTFVNRTDSTIPDQFEFSPHFTRLMVNPRYFIVSMKLIYFGWLNEQNVFTIKLPDERNIDLYDDDDQADPRIDRPITLEEALENILIKFPYQSWNNAHPLFRLNFTNTFESIEKCLESYEKQLTEETLNQIESKLMDNLKVIENRNTPFYKDLSVFLYYLIRKRQREK